MILRSSFTSKIHIDFKIMIICPEKTQEADIIPTINIRCEDVPYDLTIILQVYCKFTLYVYYNDGCFHWAVAAVMHKNSQQKVECEILYILRK